MNFFETLSNFGTLQSKRPSSTRAIDPMKHARDLFIAAVKKQLANVEENKIDKPGSWIAKVEDKYLVSLRFQLVPMKLDGENAWLCVDSIDKVMAVLRGAHDAAINGDLDDTFQAMARRPKVARS